MTLEGENVNCTMKAQARQKHTVITIFGLLMLAAGNQAKAQTIEWTFHKTADGLHPDGNEQQMVWLMNRARANPTAEGVFLGASGNADIQSGINYFRVNLNLMRAEFAAIVPQPPAAFDRRLYLGSLQHSLYLIANDTQNHNEQFTRLTNAQFKFRAGTVSVFSYSQSALEAHGALNIDWGPDSPNDADGMQRGRGHRVGIMGNYSSPLTNVGFALVPESNPNTEVGPLVFSGAYCEAGNEPDHFNRFLVGTVWADANSNNLYDPGEGLNNVRVQPDSGAWHAITGVGGGWAIPANAGTYTMTYSGAAVGSGFTRSATVATASVLVDTKYVATIPPASAFVLNATRNGGALNLTWSGGTPPYQVQTSPSMAVGSWTNVGSSTNATSLTVSPTGTRIFYRVRSN